MRTRDWRALARVETTYALTALCTTMRTTLSRLRRQHTARDVSTHHAAVHEMISELSQAHAVTELVERLLGFLRTLDFQSAAILWPCERQLIVQDSYGFAASELRDWQLPRDGLISQQLTQTIQVSTSAQLRQQMVVAALSPTEQRWLAEPTICCWVPLVSRGTLLCVMLIGPHPRQQLLDEDLHALLMMISRQGAVAAENVWLLETLRRRLAELETLRDQVLESRQQLAESREAERLHLAQELHDGPVQDLYSAHFQLNMIAEQLDASACEQYLAPAQEAVQRTLTSLRVICGELRPPTLAPFGLEKAIRSHIARFKETHPDLHVHVDLMHDGQLLPTRLRLALFRIYQETLNNVVKHAQATWLLVRFRVDARHIILEVCDNGDGFEMPHVREELAHNGHLGLLGVSERAMAIGGRLQVVSAPGEGTAIRVVVPTPQ